MIDLLFTKDEIPSMENFNKRFSLIADFAGALGNEYVWSKKGEIAAHYTLGEKVSADLYHGTTQTKVYWSSLVVADDGTVTVGQEVGRFTITGGSISGCDQLRGYFTTDDAGRFVYIPTDATFRPISNATYCDHTQYVTGVAKGIYVIGYVNSPDPNAYPPAVNDGYTYTALGQLGAKVQIATGSYTGTGAYGVSNPNSLTFDFAPKMLIVTRGTRASTTDVSAVFMLKGADFNYEKGDVNETVYLRARNGGKTVEWYSTNDVGKQFNGYSTKHYYTAIG